MFLSYFVTKKPWQTTGKMIFWVENLKAVIQNMLLGAPSEKEN